MRTLFRTYMIAATVLAFTSTARATELECIAGCNTPTQIEATSNTLRVHGIKCHGTICGDPVIGMPSIAAPYGMQPSSVSVFAHSNGSKSTLTTFSN